MPNKNTVKPLEGAWTDERELKFNVEIHKLLEAAGDAIDRDGALESVNATLPIVEKIRTKLVAERDRRTGSNVVGIRSKQPAKAQPAPSDEQCRNVVELHGVIEEMDRQSQFTFDRIQALVSVSRKAIDQLTDELPRSAARAFLFDLDRTLEMIRDIAAEADNDINAAAEKVGCNYVHS